MLANHGLMKVTLGLCLIGAVGWVRGLLVVIAQILGAIAAAGIVSALFPGPLLVRTTLSTNPATTVQQGVFIEMFLTALLVFTMYVRLASSRGPGRLLTRIHSFMLAAEKHKGTFIAPVGIGLALFVAALAGGYFTGGSLNPARSFGPDVVLGTFEGYHWIYWLGPALGAVVAVLFYRLIKTLEYETANPGQDSDYGQSQANRFKSDEDPEAGNIGPTGRAAGRSAY
jgi:aquaporin related protein